jgi:hypothetical protein
VKLFTQNPALKKDSFSGRKYNVDVFARYMKVSSCCLKLLQPHTTDSTNAYRCYYIKTVTGFLRNQTYKSWLLLCGLRLVLSFPTLKNIHIFPSSSRKIEKIPSMTCKVNTVSKERVTQFTYATRDTETQHTMRLSLFNRRLEKLTWNNDRNNQSGPTQ